MKKIEQDELRIQCKQEKCCDVFEIYECDWWKMYKTDKIVKQHLPECCPYKMPLRGKRLLENIKSGSLFCYFYCDIEVPGYLREAFAHLHPSLRNFLLVEMTLVRFRKNMPRKRDF